ncbi:hypothetical protein DFJ43DRAFT_1035306 [Lentinula guzmanii]|uniref:Uncharacterized protein n=1 Tax=Lentinula guzmanii TaxID=2804957 RepID=A0AA38JWD9_9AGAR|nr:hypothetical protein DFJ43DRAFT_1035306 [Lentinula guzmanii]
MPRPQPTANYYRPPSFHPYPASSPSLTPRLTSTPNPIFPPPPSSQRPQQSHSLYPTPSRSHTPHSLPAPMAVRYPVQTIPRSSVSSLPSAPREKISLIWDKVVVSNVTDSSAISKPAQVSSESDSGASPTAGRKDMLSSSHKPLPSRFLSDIGNHLQGSSGAASHSEAQCSADSPVGLGLESAARSPVFPISGEIQPELHHNHDHLGMTTAVTLLILQHSCLIYLTDHLANVIAKICDSLETQMDQVQREYRVPLARVRKMVGLHWSQRGKKEPSAYNVGVFIKARELNEDLSKGYKHQAPEIHQALQEDDDMMKEIEDPESKVVEKWRQEMKDSKEDKFVGTRGSSRAVRRQGTVVMSTSKRESRVEANTIFIQMENLSKLTGAFTFGMMCKGDFSTSITPAFWGIGPMEDFLMDTFKMSGFDFVNAAQSYACLAALKGKGMTNDQMKESIASMISRGIQELTGRKIRMEYKNYSVKIVKKLRADDVKELYDLLRSGSLRWAKLSVSEYRTAVQQLDDDISNGTVNLPSRSTRSDKGKKHTSSGKRNRNGEKELCRKRRKIGRRTGRKYRSDPIGSDDEDDDEEDDEDKEEEDKDGEKDNDKDEAKDDDEDEAKDDDEDEEKDDNGDEEKDDNEDEEKDDDEDEEKDDDEDEEKDDDEDKEEDNGDSEDKGRAGGDANNLDGDDNAEEFDPIGDMGQEDEF